MARAMRVPFYESLHWHLFLNFCAAVWQESLSVAHGCDLIWGSCGGALALSPAMAPRVPPGIEDAELYWECLDEVRGGPRKGRVALEDEHEAIARYFRRLNAGGAAGGAAPVGGAAGGAAGGAGAVESLVGLPHGQVGTPLLTHPVACCRRGD